MFETGIPNFLNLIVTVLRTRFTQQEHKIIKLINYEKFNTGNFSILGSLLGKMM